MACYGNRLRLASLAASLITAAMTCLHPNAISQPDGDQPSSNPILSSLLLQSIEHLRMHWRSLGLSGDPFLSASDLQPRLQSFNARRLHRILGLIMQLCEDGASCVALDSALRCHVVLQDEAPALASLVLELSVLLDKVPDIQRTSQAPRQASQGDGLLSQPLDVSNLSIRTTNAMRRNGFHRIGDLAGIDEDRLSHCRDIGATSIAEVRRMLESYGLDLPFSAETAEGIASPEVSAAPMPSHRSPDLELLMDDSANRCWCEQAVDCIRQHAATTPALTLIKTLNRLCDANPEALAGRREELHRLSTILQQVHSSGVAAGTSDTLLAAEILQRKLLERYAQQVSGVFPAGVWLREVGRVAERATAICMLLQQATGLTLEQIGLQRSPAITGESVRQKIKSVELLCSCTGRQFREEVRRSLVARDGQTRGELLHDWIQSHGRLPYRSDSALLNVAGAVDSVLLQVANASLQKRLETYRTFGLAVPGPEWDLHCRVICQRGRHLGIGYWHNIETLRQFLPRFAAAQGKPGEMPLQTELPPAVHGAVTRHGGQGPVAAAVGLIYRGQLMGTDCRRYWTHERLADLLQQTAEHHQLPAGAMPSKKQIQQFLTSGAVSAYSYKRPATVFVALKGYSRMSWQEVALKFCRHYN
jgi:cell wall assembly regulator SMI1